RAHAGRRRADDRRRSPGVRGDLPLLAVGPRARPGRVGVRRPSPRRRPRRIRAGSRWCAPHMIDDDDRMETIRRQGRRLAWLMAGAAIGLAVVLLVVVVAAVAVGVGPVVDRGSGTDEGAGSALGGAGAA